MLFDIKLVLISQKAGLKFHRALNLGTRNVDMSTREVVNSESCNSNTRVIRRKAVVSGKPIWRQNS